MFYCLFFTIPVCEIIGIWRENIRKRDDNQKKMESLEGEIDELEKLTRKVNGAMETRLMEMIK